MDLFVWAIYVITALEGGDYQYTHIKSYDDRMKCEIEASVFTVYYEPWADNETVECLKAEL